MDNGGLGHELLNFDNVEVHIFSIQNGWNFDSPRIIEEFLDKMRRENPDRVWFAPPCTKWTQLQELNVAQQGEHMANQLKEERRKLERTHVKVSVDGFDIQGKEGRHAYIEHPARSLMWQTAAHARLRRDLGPVRLRTHSLQEPDPARTGTKANAHSNDELPLRDRHLEEVQVQTPR